ncbi:F0F1 ATP synthase subunit A [Mycetocola zhadangensis]|uniref:F0F1 ATP synthase subunit A n=1 Tax=Mycetocola zhadangensis TaxID=1164595 RepID=UPI0019A1A76D|nr:F0F1 ATP synthase subunit A [Mycetocola zhadangensis]GGF01954.1 ATP synthase subunit a [Mycetocola zhadangensis]
MNLVTNVSVLTAAEDDGGFHAPTLAEFFPPAIFFEGTPFEMNRIVLVRMLAVLVMLLLFWLALRRGTRVPGRGQSVAEMAIGFVKDQIGDQVLGAKDGKRFLPLLAGMFFGILAMNLTGIIPGLNIAGSSIFIVPATFALAAYIAFVYAGIKQHGGWKYFKNQLFLPGVPWPIYIILTPVELLNIFIVRPISLSLRLLLNMMVGHLLLVLCFSATHFFFITGQDLGLLSLFGVATLVGGIAMTGIELAVAVLQAYIFTLLTAVYIQQSVADEH